MKKVSTTLIASPPTGMGAVGKAWDAVSVSFDRFCLTAGIEAFGTMMDKAFENIDCMSAILRCQAKNRFYESTQCLIQPRRVLWQKLVVKLLLSALNAVVCLSRLNLISPFRRRETSPLHTAALLRRGFFCKKARRLSGRGSHQCRDDPGWLIGNDDAQYRSLSPVRPCRSLMYSNGFTSKHHHLPDCFAVVKKVETEIDLVQFQATAHQPIHWQLAAPIKLDVAGYIANRYAGADVTALHGPLLGDKVDLRQRKGVVGRRQACRHCGAAPVGDPVCKVQGAYGTGHFEGEFDSATGRGSDLLDRIRVSGIECIRSSELSRQPELVVRKIDRNYAPRADCHSSQERAQADTAETDHGHARTG